MAHKEEKITCAECGEQFCYYCDSKCPKCGSHHVKEVIQASAHNNGNGESPILVLREAS